MLDSVAFKTSRKVDLQILKYSQTFTHFLYFYIYLFTVFQLLFQAFEARLSCTQLFIMSFLLNFYHNTYLLGKMFL